MVDEKKCYKCSIVKPMSEFFYVNKNLCGLCWREVQKNHQKKEKAKAWMREYGKARNIKFKDKNIARAKTRAAVAAGKIVKPENCDNCGEALRLEGHHNDYDKPLEVEWLCNMCHKHKHGRAVDPNYLKKIGAIYES